MNTTASQRTDIIVSRLIKAPRERVFAAWTTPSEIMKWFGPDTCHALSAEIDLRVGGEYKFKVKSEMMGETDLAGVYREVNPPSRLVYTWNWKSGPMAEMGETVVTVDFAERNGGTEVQITHTGFVSSEGASQHSYGWNGCLDKLEKAAVGECSKGPMGFGSFVWNELLTSDVPAAGKFYSNLFGWQTVDMDMGSMIYTLIKKDGKDGGGMMKLPMENVPPHWLAYVAVENADATASEAAKTGGRVIAPPFDVPTVGRLAVLMDPHGAAFAIIQPQMK
jgi:predicted enzyme related to lactoylglutathione lyase/uncharacterized protein YndB with AHSA1/START domain